MARQGGLTGTRGFSVKLDWISGFLMVTAGLIFLYGTVFLGMRISDLAMASIIILLTGISFALLFKTFTVDLHLSRKELAGTIRWTLISIGAVAVINYVAPRSFEAVGFDPRLFGVLIATAEEVMFRLFLLPWLLRLTGNAWVAIGLSALAFMTYHFYRYGGDWTALFIVLAGGAILGHATIQTQRITSSMGGHCLVNLLAA